MSEKDPVAHAVLRAAMPALAVEFRLRAFSFGHGSLAKRRTHYVVAKTRESG
jgi:hypothetical protein